MQGEFNDLSVLGAQELSNLVTGLEKSMDHRGILDAVTLFFHTGNKVNVITDFCDLIDSRMQNLNMSPEDKHLLWESLSSILMVPEDFQEAAIDRADEVVNEDWGLRNLHEDIQGEFHLRL